MSATMTVPVCGSEHIADFGPDNRFGVSCMFPKGHEGDHWTLFGGGVFGNSAIAWTDLPDTI